jgi:hypothetical protein
VREPVARIKRTRGSAPRDRPTQFRHPTYTRGKQRRHRLRLTLSGVRQHPQHRITEFTATRRSRASPPARLLPTLTLVGDSARRTEEGPRRLLRATWPTFSVRVRGTAETLDAKSSQSAQRCSFRSAPEGRASKPTCGSVHSPGRGNSAGLRYLPRCAFGRRAAVRAASGVFRMGDGWHEVACVPRQELLNPDEVTHHEHRTRTPNRQRHHFRHFALRSRKLPRGR